MKTEKEIIEDEIQTVDFYTTIKLIFSNDNYKKEREKLEIIKIISFILWIIFLSFTLFSNFSLNLWNLNDGNVTLFIFFITIFWTIYFISFITNKEANFKNELFSFLSKHEKLEEIHNKVEKIWLKWYKNPWSNYIWYKKWDLKILELHYKDNNIIFRLRHKNINKDSDFGKIIILEDKIPNIDKIIDKTKDNNFKPIKIMDTYRNSIFIDYNVDINTSDDIKKGLDYVQKCYNSF